MNRLLAAIIAASLCVAPWHAALADPTGKAAPPPSPVEAAMPQMERDYLEIVLDARKQYQSARTAEARESARAGMQIRLHRLLGLDHEARDWTGTIQNVQTLPGGDRAVSIELGPDITLSTWQNRFFDGEYATLIPPDSPFYHALDGANAGDPVRFNATLIGSRVASDDEMVRRPELIARLIGLRRLE